MKWFLSLLVGLILSGIFWLLGSTFQLGVMHLGLEEFLFITWFVSSGILAQLLVENALCLSRETRPSQDGFN